VDTGDDLDIVLPSADDLASVLLALAVPHEDIDILVSLLPGPDRDPALWRHLEHCTKSLVRRLGTTEGIPAFPTLAGASDVLQRYFPVYVFVAALPHVKAFHRNRGITDEISWHTLTDLGRAIADHRHWYGVGGLDAELTSWLTSHFRGLIYQLGRLQFQRATLGNRTGKAIAAAGHPCGPGDPALAVHVPAFHGPMTSQACELSFEAAVEFFKQHFPAEMYRVAVCHSWLLDPQLAEYLPPKSNIIQFQRRFQPAYQPKPDDHGILRFVFGQAGIDRASAPRRTRLERAVLDHLDAGRHWHGGAGWTLLTSGVRTT
jgi:hypothetical protein